ncbi:hypothetical protein MN116_004667 [Schistosoma mekongi]|uniref:Snurportin-1 n=1 Tax=Schistosoma mekongi TaxID=38744 RepID=A0AAE2D4S4_SCHME|nr:hypothetical protein MN116_004667 [Schistosoma mekongi]
MDLDSLCQHWDSTLDIDEENFEAVVESEKHPRLSLYKNKGRAADQEKRWRQKLSILKSKNERLDQFDHNRFPLNEQENSKHPWSSTESKSKIKSWRRHSKVLMLAEWFLFMPPDFEEEYLMKICPKGRHVFIKASKGKTTIYTRNGRLLISSVSRLPGGGLGQSDNQNNSYTTLLDCILYYPEQNTDFIDFQRTYESKQMTFECYVVDLIYMRSTAYVNLPFYDRSQWLEHYLRQQIEEYDEGDVVVFHILPSYPCDIESMQMAFASVPPYEIDGVLFYHKDVNYEPGATPLVSWLKPYMLPEWFPNINYHSDFLKDIPDDYTDYLNEIQQYEAKNKSPKSTITQTIAE